MRRTISAIKRADKSGEDVMRQPNRLMLAVGAALLLFGAAPAVRAEPVKIRIAWVVPVVNWPSMLLEKQDLARHMGKSYTVEPVRYAGTPQMITAMATGDLDIGDLAFSSLGLAIQNAGMDDLRVIADDFQDGVGDYYSNEFMVRADSPIQKVEDLKGKVIMTNAGGSAVDITMRAMMRKHGVDDNKDVNFVEAPFPNMKAMLLEKKVDLIPGVPPFSGDPELRSKVRVLFVQKEAVGRTQMIILAARASFLQKHRAALVDFLEDTIRMVHFYIDPANRTAVSEIAGKLAKQPPERFASWLFTKKDYYRDPNMVPDLAALQTNMDVQRDLGFLKGRIDVAKHADLTLVKEAAARVK
jgi:NitT/TauT family transport system substrate-binding protein